MRSTEAYVAAAPRIPESELSEQTARSAVHSSHRPKKRAPQELPQSRHSAHCSKRQAFHPTAESLPRWRARTIQRGIDRNERTEAYLNSLCHTTTP